MKSVPGPNALLAVEHQKRNVRALELLLNAPSHARRQRVAWTLNARQVNEDDLRVAARAHPPNRPPCRLRAVGDDCDLLADDNVDERGLAPVRPTRQGNETAARQGPARASSSRWSANISPSSVS